MRMDWFKKIFSYYYLLALLSALSLASGLVYFFYRLNPAGIVLALILALGLLAALNHFLPETKNTNAPTPPAPILTKWTIWLGAAFLFCAAVSFFWLVRARTDASLLTPWSAVSPLFFLFYGAAALFLGFLSAKISSRAGWPLFSLFYFLAFSAAAIVYKIGYGFDPFIHQAALDVIDTDGLIEPKTFYYLGQYGLEIIIHKITFLPLPIIDRWLVPALAAIFLPWSLGRRAPGPLSSDLSGRWLSLLGLLLPFGIFIVTTPQNLAFLFLIIIIINGLSLTDTRQLATNYGLALAALITQPIAGLPALSLIIFLHIYHSDQTKKAKLFLSGLVSAGAALALPAAFFLFQRPEKFSWPGNFWKSIFPAPVWPDKENVFLNSLYFFGGNRLWIYLALVAAGAALAFFARKEKIFRLYALLAGLTLAAAGLTATLNFSFLIAYEQGDYPARIAQAAGLFCLPFAWLAFTWFGKKIARAENPAQCIWLAGLSALLAASAYLSYPRLDRYHNARGWSTGADDLRAVQFIRENAGGRKYLVLANQQVSAAALHLSGFAPYYEARNASGPKEKIFYYPIPTGGPLYEIYLKMVYERPSRKNALSALALADADVVYFVLNNYWWAFPKIRDEAKLAADEFQTIADKKIYVFKYEAGAGELIERAD